MNRNEATVTFEDVKCLHETDGAILVEVDGEKVWIPKVCVHDDSEVFDAEDNSTGKLVVTERIALQKGLI